jgi:hypothetical protein
MYRCKMRSIWRTVCMREMSFLRLWNQGHYVCDELTPTPLRTVLKPRLKLWVWINSRSSFETALKLRSAAVCWVKTLASPLGPVAKLRGQMLCAFDSDIWSVKTTPAVISKRPEPRSTPPPSPLPLPPILGWNSTLNNLSSKYMHYWPICNCTQK